MRLPQHPLVEPVSNPHTEAAQTAVVRLWQALSCRDRRLGAFQHNAQSFGLPVDFDPSGFQRKGAVFWSSLSPVRSRSDKSMEVRHPVDEFAWLLAVAVISKRRFHHVPISRPTPAGECRGFSSRPTSSAYLRSHGGFRLKPITHEVCCVLRNNSLPVVVD